MEGPRESELSAVATLRTGGHGIAALLQKPTARHHVLSLKASLPSVIAISLLVSQSNALPQGTETSFTLGWEHTSMSAHCKAQLFQTLVISKWAPSCLQILPESTKSCFKPGSWPGYSLPMESMSCSPGLRPSGRMSWSMALDLLIIH